MAARKLTPKQEAFVRFYIETGNASEAYRRAYNTSKMKPATIKRSAHELLENHNVTATIADLHSKAADKAVLDKAWVLDRLMRNARVCLGEETMKLKLRKPRSDEVVEIEAHLPDAAGANRALELLGKELKMFIDRKEIGITRYDAMTDEQLRDQLTAAIREAGTLGLDFSAGNSGSVH